MLAAATHQTDVIASLYMRIDEICVGTIGTAPRLTCSKFQRKPVCAAAKRKSDTDAGTTAAVAAGLGQGVLRGQQFDLVLRHKSNIAACVNLAADDGDIAIFSGAVCDDANVACRVNSAAHCRIAGLLEVAFGLAG